MSQKKQKLGTELLTIIGQKRLQATSFQDTLVPRTENSEGDTGCIDARRVKQPATSDKYLFPLLVVGRRSPNGLEGWGMEGEVGGAGG